MQEDSLGHIHGHTCGYLHNQRDILGRAGGIQADPLGHIHEQTYGYKHEQGIWRRHRFTKNA